MAYFYRMLCRSCGYEVRRADTTHFLKRFFVGCRCPKCGYYHADRLFDADWKISFGRYIRPVKFNLFNAKTWFVKQVWEEKE